MIKMRKALSFVFIFFLFSSCELTKEIDYSTIYEGDKIVIRGFISPDGVQVIVKKTVPPNKVNADDRLENAKIDLYEDNIRVTSLIAFNSYLYKSPLNFSMKLGSDYYITVEAPGFVKVVSASQTIFNPVQIDTLYLKIEDLTNYGNIIVSFNVNQKNNLAYYIKTFKYVAGEVDSSSIGSEIFNPYGLIDKTVNGNNIIECQVGHISTFDSLIVNLYSLSPDLKKYLKSVQYYESSKEDPFFEQTYPVYTNIEGGYGIFASYSYSTKIILK
jgi:hypothetical protein